MHNVLSIQSFVSYGHAGNSSATFPLQRLGINVLPVHTVLFSNHTGYETWRGPLVPAEEVAEVIRGIDERGVLARTDAVLSGYLGSPEVGQVILDAAELTKRRNPEALLLADPVMGDTDTGFYCQDGIPEFFRDRIVPVADIMTPNLFELEQLTGTRLPTLTEVIAAAEDLRRRGPRIVLVTSVIVEDLSDGRLRMLAVTAEGTWLVETPLLQRGFVGTGDLTAALFLAHWLVSGEVDQALGATASAVYSVLEQTTAMGEQELQLVAAQEQLVNPVNRFTPRRLPRTC